MVDAPAVATVTFAQEQNTIHTKKGPSLSASTLTSGFLDFDLLSSCAVMIHGCGLFIVGVVDVLNHLYLCGQVGLVVR